MGGNDKSTCCSGMTRTQLSMLVMGILGAVVVGLQVEVINHWPLPVSIAPYFGARTGAVWGGIVGVLVGMVIAYITDESHFE